MKLSNDPRTGEKDSAVPFPTKAAPTDPQTAALRRDGYRALAPEVTLCHARECPTSKDQPQRKRWLQSQREDESTELNTWYDPAEDEDEIGIGGRRKKYPRRKRRR